MFGKLMMRQLSCTTCPSAHMKASGSAQGVSASARIASSCFS